MYARKYFLDHLFCSHLCQFVELRKYEQMSVRQFLVGLKLSHCDWLKSAGQGRHTPLTSSVKQLELLSKWIYWLVNSLVIKTLKVKLHAVLMITACFCDKI